MISLNYKTYREIGVWIGKMYKYKGRYYKVLGWKYKRVLLKEYRKVLCFYIPKKQKAFWEDGRNLKKMKWIK